MVSVTQHWLGGRSPCTLDFPDFVPQVTLHIQHHQRRVRRVLLSGMPAAGQLSAAIGAAALSSATIRDPCNRIDVFDEGKQMAASDN